MAVGLLAALITYDLSLSHLHISGTAWLSNTIFVLFLIALFTVPGAGDYQFVIRSRKTGAVSLVLSLIILTASVPALSASMILSSLLGPSEDEFGKNITIPADMTYTLPLSHRSVVMPVPADLDSRTLAGAVSNFSLPDGDPVVNVDLEVLNKFAGENRARLLRHLASSAKWSVTCRGNSIHAVRGYAGHDGRWEPSLDVHFSADSRQPDRNYYQTYILICVDGAIHGGGWWRRSDTEVMVGAGATTLTLKENFNKGQESYFVVRSRGPSVEIFEDSKIRSRPITDLALSQIDSELKALLQSETGRTSGFDPDLLPPGSFKTGLPELHVVNGSQAGIYEVFAYANPGQAGYVYLKVFEATRSQRLSEYRIAQRSTEYTGWSADPNIQFLYNTQITVFEGDWGVYYPARFELWFVPTSGGQERKLIEKIFKIEGWMR